MRRICRVSPASRAAAEYSYEQACRDWPEIQNRISALGAKHSPFHAAVYADGSVALAGTAWCEADRWLLQHRPTRVLLSFACGECTTLFRRNNALRGLCWPLCLSLIAASPLEATETAAVADALLSHAGDHGFMWWAHGWRGRSPENHRVFCIQTNHYGLAFDVERATLTHLGPIARPLPAQEAVSQNNEVIFGLPRVQLVTTIEFDGARYRAVSVAPRPEDVRIVEHGRFFQRIELLKIRFESEDGRELQGLESRFEIVSWPDRLAILLHVEPRETAGMLQTVLRLQLNAQGGQVSEIAPNVRTVGSPGGGDCFTVSRSPGTEWALAGRASGAGIQSPRRWQDDRQPHTLALVVFPASAGGRAALIEHSVEKHVTVDAIGITPYQHRLEAPFNPREGSFRVRLGDPAMDGWSPVSDPDRLERVALTLRNDADVALPARIAFNRESRGKLPGIIGLSPMIRDEEGFPLGLPVQISKNWHEADWFNGSTMVSVPPRSTIPVEFAIAYQNWGGVPAVSHAQLCLIGWGVNQLWHEVALGSYGEAICYDPDINLNRAMIDDMRPLLVRRMGARDRPSEPPGWTNNVGGGDFLVYFDEQNRRQWLSRMKSLYSRYGPNLSEVTYAGRTQDGRIDAHITVLHYRTDDLTRGLYRVRYDVRERSPFQRLAFFQLGADRYNDHQFKTAAWGNLAGVVEEWSVKPEGRGYARPRFPCSGESPWFSLHDAIPGPELPGAWANRGAIIRSWRARLGGREAPTPFAGMYHTLDRVPSQLLELTPPPGVSELLPGDYVGADIEVVVLPMSAEDYLGPNRRLREALSQNANTWRMVWREAVENRWTLSASRGRVLGSFPPRVQCDAAGEVEFALQGGAGYVPVTLSGVSSHRGWILEQHSDTGWSPVNQAVHGNDFWQTDYRPGGGCDLTFNLADAGPGRPCEYRLRLRWLGKNP